MQAAQKGYLEWVRFWPLAFKVLAFDFEVTLASVPKHSEINVDIRSGIT